MTTALHQKVDAALTELKKVLDETRRPAFADEIPHTYDDKYMLAEFLTSSMLAATYNCLERLGLTSAELAKLSALARNGREVTLRLRATETCEHLREAVREVVSPTKLVSESSIFGKSERSVVTSVTEHFWKFQVSYELVAFAGADPDASSETRTLLQGRKAHCEIMTTTQVAPKPKVHVVPPEDVSLSWLLSHLSENSQLRFKIDRSQDSCCTPLRNEQADDACHAASAILEWARRAYSYIEQVFRKVQPTSTSGNDDGKGHGLDLPSIAVAASHVLVPVLPVFAVQTTPLVEMAPNVAVASGNEANTSLIRLADLPISDAMVGVSELNTMLAEQRRSLEEKERALELSFPEPQEGTIISVVEAKMVLVLRHMWAVLDSFLSSLHHIERMLRSQLVAAIGKEVGPTDFARYMQYHDARTYCPAFAPQPFCIAVRRPGMYPEGNVAIESLGLGENGEAEPILSWRREVEGPPMTFSLSTSTTVEFTGERVLHGYIAQQFSDSVGPHLQLTARARQFSSFMLLLGRIGPNHTFQPQHAMIVKNKDDVVIPLLLEQLPTPKEFRDAIESLSPEQKRFAQAYRTMQLEGSVFALLVVQLKPQLEMLLGLPASSLTKEIQLTQDLLQLFIEHQIPSDLLSYDGDERAAAAEKLAAVKQHVAAIFTMIKEAKDAELQAAKDEHAFANPRAMFGGCDGALAEDCVTESMAVDERASPPVARMRKGSCRRKEVAQCAMADICCDSDARPRYRGRCSPPLPAPGAAPEPCEDSLLASTSVPTPAKRERPEESAPQVQEDWEDGGLGVSGGALDFTSVPAALDAQYAEHDVDSALRPTKLKVGERWRRSSQKALLGKPVNSSLLTKQQKEEKDKAFDLLDALSRSGALPLACTSLHVVVAATHCFDESLMDAVIVKNVNPIEKLERSALIMASTIHAVKPGVILHPSQHERVAEFSAPKLLPPEAV